MCNAPTKLYVTTDAVALRLAPGGGLELLLVERGHDPFCGTWALPGGFVEEDEDLPDACARELEEETGVRAAALVQLGAWGTPGRDPRGRNVSVVYLAPVRPDAADARAGDDAARARWHSVGELPPLAFDHADIVERGLEQLGVLVAQTHLLYALLPERFVLDELREALRAVRGRPVAEDEMLAWMARAQLSGGQSATPGAGDSWRCAAADFLAPLR